MFRKLVEWFRGLFKRRGLRVEPRSSDLVRAPWMVIARNDLHENWNEIKGPEKTNPKISECFKLCGYPYLDDSEYAWCGVYTGRTLIQAGLKPPKKCAWARNYSLTSWGLPLGEPRYGAVVNVERGSPGGTSHVGFIVGWDDEYILIHGGNQSNQVNDTLVIPRSDIISIKWPTEL